MAGWAFGVVCDIYAKRRSFAISGCILVYKVSLGKNCHTQVTSTYYFDSKALNKGQSSVTILQKVWTDAFMANQQHELLFYPSLGLVVAHFCRQCSAKESAKKNIDSRPSILAAISQDPSNKHRDARDDRRWSTISSLRTGLRYGRKMIYLWQPSGPSTSPRLQCQATLRSS